jgi:hypothetical protein
MAEPQKLNDGHYFLDKNELELERLNLGHIIIKDHMQKLVWAPIDLSKPSLRILDSAAANGTYPHSHVPRGFRWHSDAATHRKMD